MYNYITNLLKSQYAKKWLVFALFLFIFFPVRKVLISQSSYLTGEYSDFTTFSLYLSDILLIITAFLLFLPKLIDFLPLNKAKIEVLTQRALKIPVTVILLALILITFFYNLTLFKALNLIFLINTLKLFVAYGTFYYLFKHAEQRLFFVRVFSIFSGLQSIIALWQFSVQNSIGLYKIGETHLSPAILGVAKIVSGGTTFIRGAGTFPHPNPLSAFLVLGVIFSIYMVLNADSRKTRRLYCFLTFLNILGLTVTFSRGAYIALAVSLIGLFGYLFYKLKSGTFKQSLWSKWIPQLITSTLIVIIVSLVLSFIIFKPFIISRSTFSDQATQDRSAYNRGGLEMINENSIFGVGMGESLLHMEHALGKSLAPWDKQPPHNYFLLSASELGIPTALVLLYIFFIHFLGIIKKLKSENDFSKQTLYLALTVGLAAILVLMQFDHYFYSLTQTQYLLWIFLALVSSETL